MVKAAFTTILGLLVLASGIYLSYLYLISLNGHSKPWLLGLSLPFLILGIVVLIRANKTDDSAVIKALPDDMKPYDFKSDAAGAFENVMQKNNELVSDWIKESEKKDKMKILEIAAAAEEEQDKKAKTGT